VSVFPQESTSSHAPRPVRPPVQLDLRRSNSRSVSPSRRRGFGPLTPLTAGSPAVAGGSSGGNPSDGKRGDYPYVGFHVPGLMISVAPSITYSGRDTPDYTDSEDIHDTMGQLSLDDASQIRYHGKASGLHLLGQTERVDRRAENGIWWELSNMHVFQLTRLLGTSPLHGSGPQLKGRSKKRAPYLPVTSECNCLLVIIREPSWTSSSHT
jgi:hypothetical protein